MRMMFDFFARKLFGVKYEHLKRVFLTDLIVFLGLRIAEYRVAAAPFIVYLMVSTFSAGVMWRALSSDESAANMKNLYMLPFEERTFVYSYVSAVGAYTLFTKTSGLLAVVLAVCTWSGETAGYGILCAVLCAVNAVLVSACVYTWGRRRSAGILWGGAVIAAIVLMWNKAVFLPIMIGSSVVSVLILSRTGAYAFYRQESGSSRRAGSGRHFWVWRYLFRYLLTHKNYMMNTLILWGAACVLPVFFRQIDAQNFAQTKGQFVMPVGFAILSVNTPVGILLSCDPAMEQAVRCLPGQVRAFCIPYTLFLFLCNMTADFIFLCSSEVQTGGVTAATVLMAVFFALFGAIGSVMLEWFFPIRGWNIENDLWHHPRKYVVPVVMLLLAGAVAALYQMN